MTNVETTNLSLSIETARRKEGSPAPSPYERRFLPPPVDEDHRPGPSYYSEAFCARTAGTQSKLSDRPISITDGEDDHMDAESLNGEDIDVYVTDGEYMPDEGEQIKRGRGQRLTHGKYVRIREKRKEETSRKRETEQELRAKEALNPNAPKGAKWTNTLKKEKKKEEELRCAPTEDIASQLYEHSAVLFKTADCSNRMKGSLVS